MAIHTLCKAPAPAIPLTYPHLYVGCLFRRNTFLLVVLSINIATLLAYLLSSPLSSPHLSPWACFITSHSFLFLLSVAAPLGSMSRFNG